MRITTEQLEDTIDSIDWAYEDKAMKITEGKLKGYKLKVKRDGEHKHDGQVVDYTFIFTSPAKKKTTIETPMCLMVGWNFHKKSFEIA